MCNARALLDWTMKIIEPTMQGDSVMRDFIVLL